MEKLSKTESWIMGMLASGLEVQIGAEGNDRMLNAANKLRKRGAVKFVSGWTKWHIKVVAA